MYHKGKPMSRRPLGAADADSRAILELSRRQIIAGSVAVATVKDLPAQTDASVDVCRAWLAREEEHEALIRRWQKLENYLIHERSWLELSEQECAAIPEVAELDSIDERLDALHATKHGLLTALPALRASTPQGLALKLSVAAIIVRPDENEDAHNLVISILRDLQKLKV
ncbi:MAG: hypothetical protein V7651_09150 [Hyphomonas oceanitis]|uniref:hypothetical protein n=1 Tax=Hyphomonas oceanitis TaxID=81033 RepID=UPI003000FFB6